MKWSRWLFGAALVTLAAVSYFAKQPVVAFTSLAEFRSCIQNSGYHCTTDSLNGAVSNGVLISRESMEPAQVGRLCKTGPMGSAWQGKIWVTHSPDNWQLHSIPDDAGTRIWGNLIAFGDPELLAELDETLGTLLSKS